MHSCREGYFQSLLRFFGAALVLDLSKCRPGLFVGLGFTKRMARWCDRLAQSIEDRTSLVLAALITFLHNL